MYPTPRSRALPMTLPPPRSGLVQVRICLKSGIEVVHINPQLLARRFDRIVQEIVRNSRLEQTASTFFVQFQYPVHPLPHINYDRTPDSRRGASITWNPLSDLIVRRRSEASRKAAHQDSGPWTLRRLELTTRWPIEPLPEPAQRSPERIRHC